MGEALLKMLAHTGGLDEQITGTDEQVEEIECPGSLLQRLVLGSSFPEFGLQRGGKI